MCFRFKDALEIIEYYISQFWLKNKTLQSHLKNTNDGGAWVAQYVKRPTQVMISGS